MHEGVIVVGASGHAKVVIELLFSSGHKVAYCVGGHDSQDRCLNVPVLKGDDHLPTLLQRGYSNVFIAIGNNQRRRQLADECTSLGFKLVNAVSPQAVISPTARLGKGIAVMAGAVINSDTVIGDLAIINTGASVDHDCHIGIGVHLAPQCALAGNVTVGANAFLGIGCKVIPGVSIGENAIMGAGSVVISTVPANATALGVPARITKHHS
jgi:UDP-perosamine 4-acetyltransferase